MRLILLAPLETRLRLVRQLEMGAGLYVTPAKEKLTH